MIRPIALSFVSFVLATCAAAEPVASGPIGRIYHYVRSNLDGSQPEHIRVFRRDAKRIEVYKMVQTCTNAALVTADLDDTRGHAPRLVGGRLKPNAEHEGFAFLALDPTTNRVAISVNLPQEKIEESIQLNEPAFRMFDFDLSDLTVFGPGLTASRKPIVFDMVLIWPPAKTGERLRNLGRAELTPKGEETLEGVPTLRYEATGPAFGEKGGPIWFDKAQGHVIDVKWGIPNHAEYNSFRLKLQGIDDGGATTWDKLLRSHFEGCK
jgi:hypothetical protein